MQPRISISNQALKRELIHQQSQPRRCKVLLVVVLLVTREELNRGHLSRAKGGQRKKARQAKARLKHRPRLLRAHLPEIIQELDLDNLPASKRS